MKTSKKILSFILTIMMIISIIPISASAAQPALTIKVNNTEPNVGDTIIVDVYISENSNIGALTVDLCYDSSVLIAVSMTSYGIFNDNDVVHEAVNYNYTNGKARFTGAKANVVTEGGKLFTVEFKVLKSSRSELSLLIDEATDDDYQDVGVITNKVVINSNNFKGDVNGDGKITAIDARLLMQHICAIGELSDSDFIIGDINNDNVISVIDARLILQCVAGLVDGNMNYKPGNTPLLNIPELKIITNSKNINVGDTVTVYLKLSENSGVSGITGDISYNSSSFELVDINNVNSSYTTINGKYADGKIRFTTVTTSTFENAERICTIIFTVIDTQNTNISLNIVDAIDVDYDPVSIIINNIVFCSEHKCDNWTVLYESSCESFGLEIGYCSVCGTKLERDIPFVPHDYELYIQEPSCTSDGYNYKQCSCGDIVYGDIISATGHNYTWYTISIATCETDGVMIGECSVCEDIDIKATPKTGHNYQNGICLNCENNTSGENTKPTCTIHSYTWETIVEASCTQRGVCIGTCSTCEYTAVDYHDAFGHNIVDGDCTNCDYTENVQDDPSDDPIEEPTDNPTDDCSCKCHKGGFFWKITLFFNKLFRTKQYCSCGVAHY